MIPSTDSRHPTPDARPQTPDPLSPLDLGVIAAYLVLTLGLGLWVSRRQATAGDYFLGARDLPAVAVMLSIVATETSALTVISIPGIGARGNLTFLQVALGYVVGRVAVAAWLLPGYFRGEQETAYERLERRFGTGVRRTVSAVFLVTRFLGDGVRIFAGAIPLALVTGWSVPVAILVMGGITLLYTWFGGLKAVVWADVLQLAVYVAGGIAALWIAVRLAGGWSAVAARAAADGKLTLLDPALSFTRPYTLLGGVIGGAMLSAASHGTDHLIVQRLLATRSLRAAQRALVGSGVLVLLQFALFLGVGIAVWAAGRAPDALAGDAVVPRFIIDELPPGFAGLVIAGILAAAMSTISSSISAMASSVTHDLYASLTGRTDPAHLLRVGRGFTLAWGVALVGGALALHASAIGRDTPAVVLALSIASVTSGALLGTYLLAGRPAVRGPHVLAGVTVTVVAMLWVLFRTPLAWPWYVPLGTLLCVATALLTSRAAPGAAEATA